MTLEQGASSPPRPSRVVLVLGLLFAVSVGLNVWQARYAASLENALRPSRLTAGTQVPPFTAIDAATGQSVEVEYDGTDRPTVLYVFTPQCHWCVRNVESIKTLAQKRSGDYRFIGISLSEQGLQQHVTTQGLPFPVYTGLSRERRERYRLTGTPQTIVVSPQGRVMQTWSGAYIGPNREQLQSYFDTALPAISADAQG